MKCDRPRSPGGDSQSANGFAAVGSCEGRREKIRGSHNRWLSTIIVSRYGFGDSESSLGGYAWYDQNSGSQTHPVGQKRPNAWGLYDMHGNVWEWCHDGYGPYPGGSKTDPLGPAWGDGRVFRGGRWLGIARHCRSADRVRNAPVLQDDLLGFRLARTTPSYP